MAEYGVVLGVIKIAAVGAFLALALFGMTLNVYSSIGIVMLLGLVTKNSILLVDCANGLRAAGRSAPIPTIAENWSTCGPATALLPVPVSGGPTPVSTPPVNTA